MSQLVEYNWSLKVHEPGNFEVGKHYWVAKGGYRVFPMSTQIDLLDYNKKVHGKVLVKQIEIKFQEFITDEDAKRCGFTRFTELGYYLEREYPMYGQLVTFLYFERLE